MLQVEHSLVDLTSQRDEILSEVTQELEKATSDFARPRKILKLATPSKSVKPTESKKRSDPVSITPRQRLREFQSLHDDGILDIVDSHLHCKPWGKQLSVKLTTIREHLQSKSHEPNVHNFVTTKATTKSMNDFISDRRFNDSEVGTRNLSLQTQHFRQDLAATAMELGIPFSKVASDTFRNFLLRHSPHRVQSRQVLASVTSSIRDGARNLVLEALRDKHFLIAFDRCSRMGEVLAIVVRFIDGYVLQIFSIPILFTNYCKNFPVGTFDRSCSRYGHMIITSTDSNWDR